MYSLGAFEGFPEALLCSTKERVQLLREGMKTRRPEPTPVPSFKQKHPEIPILTDYSAKIFPKSYWPTWPENKLSDGVSSYISADKLKERAASSGFPKMDWIHRTCKDLTSGVKLGFRGAGRLPAEGPNLKSFEAAGARACDTVAYSHVTTLTQCARMDLNKRFLPKPMTTTG